MVRRVCLFLVVIFFSCTSYAQIGLYGNVVDKNNMAVDMANAILKDSQGGYVTGCVCDSLGRFDMNGLESGTYTLQISRIGYKDYINQLDVHKDTTINVLLDSSTYALDEVTVTVKTPIIKREIDRIVLNAEKLNIVATDFMDVLKHTPGVLVQDDGISMLNKGKIIFLMNGREMNMDMKGLVAYLSSLSADYLKQIEVMTTPPAQYSAEGSAGVINFVTKDLKNNYLGGTASNRFAIGKSVYDDASFSLQYKRDRIESYVNTGIGLGRMWADSKDFIDYGSETWNTTNKKKKSNKYVVATAGIDYQWTKHSSLGAIFSYSNMQPDADNTAKTTVIDTKAKCPIKNYQTITSSSVNYNRYNANLHYTLTNIIKNKGVLKVNADYLNYSINDIVELNTLYDEDLAYKHRPANTIEIYQVKADMEFPVHHGTLSWGSAYSQSTTDNRTDYDRINAEVDLNDHFIYRENILAAYADLRYKLSEQWDFKLGLRGEYGKLDGNSIKLSQRSIKHQFDIFPTAYANYNLADNQTLSLSMSSRINRPSYVDINPFTTYVDAYTLTKGNPNPLPEKSHTLELSYTHDDFFLSASAVWKNRVISSYITDAQRLTTITTDNVMKKRMYSLDASYYFNKMDWLECDISSSVYTILSRPMPGYDLDKTSNTSLFFFVNNNIYFNKKKTLMANLWGQYQSKEKDVVGESASRYRVDVGLKSLLLDKRLSVAVEYQNLLASHTKSAIYYQGTIHLFDNIPYRVLKLSISFRFGKELKSTQNRFNINTDRF